jgi:cytochrome P450
MNAVAEESSWWETIKDPSFLIDPYPQLKAWRELGPVHHDRASDIYFVFGHNEFVKLARSPKMGRDTRLWRGGWASPEAKASDPLRYQLFTELQPQMINVNGADHQRMRGVFEQAFRPAAVAAMAPMIEAEAVKLLDALGDGGDQEFISAYAAPLPLRVVCNLFDVSEEMDQQVLAWSDSLIRVLDIITTPEQRKEALEALHDFKLYVRELIAAHRKNPGNCLLDTLVAALEEDTLNQEEAVMNLVSMLIAGHETTVTLIGNGMLCLLRNPEQLAALRADRSLVTTAVEECMRYEPGGNMILRVAIEDVPVGDLVIPAGSLVLGFIGAVNRDPAVFADPERFDISRVKNPHLTFGAGAYTCIGAGLARLEGQIAFNALLDRFSDIELAGEARWRLDRMNARSLECLPLRLRRNV